MTDLAILVPSRGRPENVARLVEKCAKTCRSNYVLHFGFDEDDPRIGGNTVAADCCQYDVRPRMDLTAWTNALADEHRDVPYLASLGDDMVPETDGWDAELITTLEHMGGGFAYPYDGRRSDQPECCVVSTPIVAALGWFALPTSTHWFIDTVWKDLGRPDRLKYRKDVTVRHLHPTVAGAHLHDKTYEDASSKLNADLAAYQKWRLLDMPTDRKKVRDACLAPAS